jgi:ankyrin repeat protein
MDYKKLYSKLTQIKSGQKFISKAAYGAKMQAAKQEDKRELSGQYIQLDLQEVEDIEKYGISQLLDDSAMAKYASFKTESPVAQSAVAAGVDLSFAKDDEFKRHVILYALTQDKFEELISGDESTPQANLEANLDIITKIYKKTDGLEHKKFDAYFNKVRDDQKGQGNWFKIGINDLKERIKLLEQESFKGFEHLLDHKDARLAIKVLSDHKKLEGRGSEFSDLDKYIEGLCRVKFADSYEAISTSALGEPRKKELEGFIVDYFKAYSKGTNVSPDTTIEEGIKRSIDSALSKSEQAEELPDVSVQYEKLDGDTLESLLNEQTNGYSIRRLPKSDLRGYYLGALTNSCQSMHGHGHNFAKLGMEDKDSGFYVLEKDGRIVGQAFSWKGTDRKSLVFDSIETLGDEHQIPAAILFMKLAKKITDNKKEYGIEQVRVGLGGQTPKVFSKFPSSEYSQHLKEADVAFYDSIRQASITDMAKDQDLNQVLAVNFLWKAIEAGHKDIVLKLIEKMTPEQIGAKNADGQTALHMAARKGSTEIAAALIEKMNSEQIAAKNQYTQTALHLAANRGHKDIVLKLIEKMTPEQIGAKTSMGFTALHMAAEAGHKDIFLKLMEQMTSEQVGAKNADGQTDLHIAVQDGHTEIFKAIIAKLQPGQVIRGEDCREAINQYLDTPDRDGMTNLQKIISSGDEKLIKTALRYKAADPAIDPDKAPATPELVDAVRGLIKAGSIKPEKLGIHEEKPGLLYGTVIHYKKPEQLTITQAFDLLHAHKKDALFAARVAKIYTNALKANPSLRHYPKVRPVAGGRGVV